MQVMLTLWRYQKIRLSCSDKSQSRFACEFLCSTVHAAEVGHQLQRGACGSAFSREGEMLLMLSLEERSDFLTAAVRSEASSLTELAVSPMIEIGLKSDIRESSWQKLRLSARMKDSL